MRDVVLSQTASRAALLADALVETVEELRLIEPGDMIGYIRGCKWATIADLVQSSAELSFRDGTLSFACMADFQVGWATPPSISLDLEFQTKAVSIFFTLLLGRRDSTVEIRNVWFATTPRDEEDGTRVLAREIAKARILPSSDQTP